MFILEFGQVVDILVNNDPQIVALVVRRDIALREGFGHGAGSLIVDCEPSREGCAES
jgi:hypothetical protein